MRHDFQPDNGQNEGGDEQQTEHGSRFVQEENAQQDGSYSSDTGPYGIGSADRYGLYGLCQQHHAEGEANQNPGSPQIIRCACHLFHLSQAEGKAGFE